RIKYFFTMLNVPNQVEGRDFVDLQIATSGIATGAHLTVILPRTEGYHIRGARRGHHGLNEEEEDQLEKSGLDKSAAFEVESNDARIFHLLVPSGKTTKIGLVYSFEAEPQAGASFPFFLILP